jgi:dipeptidyl aminopeptidase/acylaminoacyl peptidase
MRNQRSLLLVATLCLAGTAFAQEPKQPFTANDLVRLARVSDPQVSPDGKRVVYVRRDTDIDANRGRTDLWLLELDAAGAKPLRITQHSANDRDPQWSADGASLFFISDRSGSAQIWRLPVAGGEALQVTDYPLDVGSFQVSPRGDRVALSFEVFRDCADLECTSSRLAERERNKARGVVYDQLFVRHWDTWKNGTHATLHVASLSAEGRAGTPVNVMKSVTADVPSKPFGGREEFTWSPDGKRLVFSARIADRGESWSTNFDLYEAPADASAEPVNLTAANPAWDTQPVFLANGDLAYLAMSRPGFEADRFAIKLRAARGGAVRDVAPKWDRSVARLNVARNGRTLLATADDIGQHALFAIDPSSGTAARISGPGFVADYAPTAQGAVVVWGDLANPPDLYLLAGRAAPRRLTSSNADLLGARALGEFEQFSFKGWKDETVHGYVVKPFGFAPGKKFPIAFVVHGGPQVSLQNQWNFRWNAQTFAGRGFGVVVIDFHGSPGYGQAFTDSISQNWGGAPFEDLQKGFAAALGKYEWLDGKRACSLGASYGGYMQNWIAGNWPDNFRCIVNHDGIFDTRSMYYTTEELWFTEWENGGPYYDTPEIHEKWNPAHHVKNWRTPMLVIHGEQDFRVPDTQGIATFTALQRRGIESRLLYFPDENHWVLKPANSVLWYATVLDWLEQHTK